MVGDGHDIAVGVHSIDLKAAFLCQQLAGKCLEFLSGARVIEQANAVIEDFAERRPWFQHLVGNFQEIAERRIPGDQLEVGIPHTDSHRDGFQYPSEEFVRGRLRGACRIRQGPLPLSRSSRADLVVAWRGFLCRVHAKPG